MLIHAQTLQLSIVWRYRHSLSRIDIQTSKQDGSKISQGSMDAGQQIELLRRQYLQLVDPDQLSLPSDSLFRLPEVQAQIFNTMFSQASNTIAPPDRYQFRVLKRLIVRLEQAVQNPENDVRLSICDINNNLLTFYHTL